MNWEIGREYRPGKKKKKHGDIMFNLVFLLPVGCSFSYTYQNVAPGRPYLFVDMVCKWLPVQDKISIETEHNHLGTFPVIWHYLTPKH